MSKFEDTYNTEKMAERFNMKVNPNPVHVLSVLEKLGTNESNLGAPYCPCMANHSEATICPCRFMRELKACRCGLYVRPKED